MRVNPLLVSIATRSARRLALIALLLPALVVIVEVASGGVVEGRWSVLRERHLLWLLELAPAAMTFALVDLFAELRRDGEWFGAVSLGVSPRALTVALAAPAIALCIAATVASRDALPALRQRIEAVELPTGARPEPCALATRLPLPRDVPAALRARQCTAPPQRLETRMLRRLSWRALGEQADADAGVVATERRRRWIEPWLGIPIAAGAGFGLRGARDPGRALALLAAALGLVIGHALWSLSLAIG